MSKKHQPQGNQSGPPKRSNNMPYFAGAAFVIVLVAVYLVGTNMQRPNVEPVRQARVQSTDPLQTRSSVEFTKHGELRFLNKKNTLLGTVDIEIADDEGKRMQGMMFRDSMAENRAMLFVFPDEEERSFWMKNTIISLDLIYVNAKNEIISIQKNAVPYSEDSLPSNGLAKYVVEVNAGFCDRHTIRPGDHIEWKRL